MCLCAEDAGNGLVVVKELLGSPAACRLSLPDLPRVAPAGAGWCAPPAPGRRAPPTPPGDSSAMLKWLDPALKEGWDWSSTAYLGLAFD